MIVPNDCAMSFKILQVAECEVLGVSCIIKRNHFIAAFASIYRRVLK